MKLRNFQGRHFLLPGGHMHLKSLLMTSLPCMGIFVLQACVLDSYGTCPDICNQGGGGSGGMSTSDTGGGKTTSSSSQGGSGGMGGSTSSSGGQGGSGGMGGATSSTGGGGMGGSGGMGGTGGSGGAPPLCNDPPQPNAVTFKCTNSCYKVILNKLGTTYNMESSPDDSTCQDGTQPFYTHPIAGSVVMVWVGDPPNNNASQASSLGSYPVSCSKKCAPTFSPGPLPITRRWRENSSALGTPQSLAVPTPTSTSRLPARTERNSCSSTDPRRAFLSPLFFTSLNNHQLGASLLPS